MLYIAAISFVLAVICAALGFGGIAEPSLAAGARVGFFVSLVLFVVTLLIGVFRVGNENAQ